MKVGGDIKNKEVGELLENIANLLELKGDSPYRMAAYREAGRRKESMVEDVEKLQRQGRLEEIPGVGSSIAAKIDEYLRTGHLQYYENLEKTVPQGPENLMKVRGIGPKN